MSLVHEALNFKRFYENKFFRENCRLHFQETLYNADDYNKIFMASLISNAVSKDHEVLCNNHNWIKSAWEAYQIKNNPLFNDGLKMFLGELLLFI